MPVQVKSRPPEGGPKHPEESGRGGQSGRATRRLRDRENLILSGSFLGGFPGGAGGGFGALFFGLEIGSISMARTSIWPRENSKPSAAGSKLSSVPSWTAAMNSRQRPKGGLAGG